DLGSPAGNIPAANGQTVGIVVGGAPTGNGAIAGGSVMNVTPGQLLTPAQYMAVNQIVNSGRQNLQIDTAGVATGGFGTFMAGGTSTTLGSLAVPKQVGINAIGYGENNPFVVNGTANISGALFALQTAPGLASVLNFGNLTIAP